MKNVSVLRMVAIASAMVAAALLGTGPASADSITYTGPAPYTYSEFVGCEGFVEMGRDDAQNPYARGSFSLGTSTRGTVCKGWLERRESPNSPFVRISAVHTVSDVTGWYWDGIPYEARVCVGDLLYSNSYSCIGSW